MAVRKSSLVQVDSFVYVSTEGHFMCHVTGYSKFLCFMLLGPGAISE